MARADVPRPTFTLGETDDEAIGGVLAEGRSGGAIGPGLSDSERDNVGNGISPLARARSPIAVEGPHRINGLNRGEGEEE